MQPRSALSGILAATLIVALPAVVLASAPAFTRLEQELSPGGLTLEAAAMQVPLPDRASRALVPASLELRARLPHCAHLALRLRPGAGCLGPGVCVELARERPPTAAR